MKKATPDSCTLPGIAFLEGSPSQALPRQLPQRGSQAVIPDAKALSNNEKASGSALGSPFGRAGKPAGFV